MKAIIAVPVTLAMVYRAWSHKSLTPAGIFAAALTAVAHAVHPWNLPFALLIVFFLAGTRVTKVKHDVKAQLTMNASGASGGEGARTHIQVLANSAVASVLSLLHAYQLRQKNASSDCYTMPGNLLVVGIVANYAAVAADTFSSELGILSKSQPRLITSSKLRKVPPGTNGGVTIWGLVAGLLGSFIIVMAAIPLIPFCKKSSQISTSPTEGWSFQDTLQFAFALTIWGALGSVLDSFFGGWLQQSVIDTRTGRVVEGEGGKRVLVSKAGPSSMHYKKGAEVEAKLLHGEGKNTVEKQATVDQQQIRRRVQGELDKNDSSGDKGETKAETGTPALGDEKPSRVVESGSLGWLDNNEVNFLMALTMSLGAMGVASWMWNVPLQSVFAI